MKQLAAGMTEMCAQSGVRMKIVCSSFLSSLIASIEILQIFIFVYFSAGRNGRNHETGASKGFSKDRKAGRRT